MGFRMCFQNRHDVKPRRLTLLSPCASWKRGKARTSSTPYQPLCFVLSSTGIALCFTKGRQWEQEQIRKKRPPTPVCAPITLFTTKVGYSRAGFNNYTVLHIFVQVLFWAGNQGHHQEFYPSLLPKKLWLIFMGWSKKMTDSKKLSFSIPPIRKVFSRKF